jgi:LacI family transcriptional regulator
VEEFMASKPPPHRATLTDVAETLGVSKATVSKALNGRDGISPETRERVLATIAEMDYRPTTSPAHSSTRRAIAVVFDIPASPYILGVLQGALTAATDRQLDLLTRLAPEVTSRRKRSVARDWISDQRASGVVGIIGLTLSEPDGLINAASEASLPFVIVDPVDTRNRSMISIGSSNWAGARNATEHLLDLGHRRIAWIGGPDASDAARERLYGYQAALDAAGLTVDPDLIRTGRFDATAGAAHAHELLASAHPPSAIMAADDEIAVGVLATAHAMGIRVPEDVSVTGFDDTPQSVWTTPPLTTVHQHLEGMGEVAVQTILTTSEGGRPASRRVELATSLTIRSSTGPARSA